jgi:two-component system cell cycle sensor histidine kinase/response regulator CckA
MQLIKSAAIVQSDIMIVDDNPANLKLLEDILLQQGHEVRSFPLGRLALASAVRNPPDLILLDINMPEMNGYEVCDRLKSIEQLSEIPVIFLSALNETEDKVKAFRAGAVDYISKPFHFEEVHARVETHLKLYRLQQLLKLQNARLEESAVDIIFRLELIPHLGVAYINPAATVITGYSPEEYYANPNLILNIVHPDDRHLMERLLCGSSPSESTVTLRCVRRNGDQVWVEQHNRLVKDIDGRLIAIEGIVRDITARKDLEEQLRQSQKMEAVGLLAGGVAHDFNNLLTVIIGYSDLMLVDDSPTEQAVERIAQVKKAAERATSLIRQLLAFGRRQNIVPTVLDLNTVVEGSLKMLRRMVRGDIRLVTILDPTLGSVRADTHQLEQIFMNLAINASAAMLQGGKITIETRNVALDKTDEGEILTGARRRYVMLSITDTGCGMDASTKARIFEPFFTTKEQGKGTGLGLSIVYGIVKQSAGQIRVFSEPEQGARFDILLPHTQELAESPAFTGIPSEAPAGCETVLVVEDHTELRRLIGVILRIGGYEALMARDATEALRIYKEHGDSIGLVLADVIMPGMSSAVLIESLRHFNRAIKVIYMSGYTDDTIGNHGQPDRGLPFIQKPFSALDLIFKIREVLDGAVTADTPTKPKAEKVASERG